MRRLSTFLLILLALATVGCDQSTKHLAIAHFREAPHTVLPGVHLTYTENRDMAFGLLSALLSEEARLWLLTFAKSAAVLFGVIYFFRRRAVSSVLERGAVALVVAGAVGNLIDRVRLGYVVDFLQVPHWPVFNVADVAIVAGLCLYVIESWLRGAPSPDSRVPEGLGSAASRYSGP